jgi:hypothetical protein
MEFSGQDLISWGSTRYNESFPAQGFFSDPNNVKKETILKNCRIFAHMQFYRKRVVRLCFLAVTGLTFLNMSFFLAEISMLKGSYNKNVLENIARMFSTSLSEEETDSEGGEGSPPYKEVDLCQQHGNHLRFEDSYMSTTLRSIDGMHMPRSGFQEIVTPPPDRSLCA